MKQIQEDLRNAAAKEEDDKTPDGLAYHVNAFELEVEKWVPSLSPPQVFQSSLFCIR